MIKRVTIFDGENGGFVDPNNGIGTGAWASDEQFSYQTDHIALKQYPNSYKAMNSGFYFNLPIDLSDSIYPTSYTFVKLVFDMSVPYGYDNGSGWTQTNIGLRYYSRGVPNDRQIGVFSKYMQVIKARENYAGTTPYYTMPRTLVEYTLTDLTEDKFYIILHQYGTGPWVYKVYLEFEMDNEYCLIESGGDYYTIQNDTLTNVGSVLNAQLFEDYGLDYIPAWEDYNSLANPSILCWSNSRYISMTATTTGTPIYPQTIVSEAIDMSHATITGIESITPTCEGTPVFAISLDGTTWKMYNDTSEQWVTLSSDTSGMSAEVMSEISSSVWNAFIGNNNEFYIRFTLSQTVDKVTKIVVDFSN